MEARGGVRRVSGHDGGPPPTGGADESRTDPYGSAWAVRRRRAEDIVERWTSRVRTGVAEASARTRENADEILAEAREERARRQRPS